MKHPVVVLTLFAAIVRVAFVLAVPADSLRYPDSDEYLDIARHVAHGEGFVTSDGRLFARGPVYPLFLAAFGDRELPIRVAQALLGALAVPLAWALARRVASPAAAVLAALYVALDPFLVYFTGLILVEAIYALLVAVSVLLLLRLREGLRRRDAAALGLVSGVAALLHPGHLAPAALLAVAWPLLVPRGTRWALLGVYVGLTAISLAPWMVRNAGLSGRFIPVAAKAGRDLYESIGPGATGGPATEYVAWPKDLPKGEMERDDALKRECLRILREDPGRVVGLMPKKLGRFWSPVPNYDRFRSVPYLAVALAASTPLFGLGLWGAVALLRRKTRTGVMLLFFAIALTLLHLLFVGSVRYRVPVHPVLAALAAVGIDGLLRRPPESGNRLDG